MAQAVRDFEYSPLSTNDLSAAEFIIVKQDASNDHAVVAAAAATDAIVGVLQNKPKAGLAAVVRFCGTSKVLLGGTVTRGNRVTSDSSAHGVATTTNKDVILGTALASGVSGDIIEVLLGSFIPQSQ